MKATGGRMAGVRIRIGNTPRPPESYFAAFFGPVLPRLRGLAWLVDDQAVRPPDELPDAEWEAFAARQRWVAAEGDGPWTGNVDPHYACGPAFVPDYARWVNDDWCHLYGFDLPPSDWRV